MPHLLRVNANIGGIGTCGEVVTGDPVLWAELIEAGFLTDLGPQMDPTVTGADAESGTSEA